MFCSCCCQVDSLMTNQQFLTARMMSTPLQIPKEVSCKIQHLIRQSELKVMQCKCNTSKAEKTVLASVECAKMLKEEGVLLADRFVRKCSRIETILWGCFLFWCSTNCPKASLDNITVCRNLPSDAGDTQCMARPVAKLKLLFSALVPRCSCSSGGS